MIQYLTWHHKLYKNVQYSLLDSVTEPFLRLGSQAAHSSMFARFTRPLTRPICNLVCAVRYLIHGNLGINICPVACWVRFMLHSPALRQSVFISGGPLSWPLTSSQCAGCMRSWCLARMEERLSEQGDASAKLTSLDSPRCATPLWVGSVAWVGNEDWWRREWGTQLVGWATGHVGNETAVLCVMMKTLSSSIRSVIHHTCVCSVSSHPNTTRVIWFYWSMIWSENVQADDKS